MLDALRRGARTWVAKILFVLLILSFGIFWNVSDFISGVGRDALAKVGATEISTDRFQRSFQNRLAALSESSGQRISTELALQLGVDRQVMESLLGQTALLTHARELNLALSNETLVERLKREKDFQGADGTFSRAIFDSTLRQIGMSEGGFLALYREDELRRQIAEALEASAVTPRYLVEQRHQFTNETRTISHFTIDRSKVSAVPEPDEAKLKETFEQNKGDYMTPELRKVAVMILSLDDLKKEVPLTDDELKAAYDETRESYDKAERRRVQQIPFKDKAAAEEARKAIQEGKKSFLDVAKDVGAKESDINLGFLSKSQLIDPAIADAAFSLERDAISEPIVGKFATVLVRVIEIEPGKTSTFEEVKEQVRDALSKRKATTLLQDRTDLVEEDRNAGKSFKEIAETHKLRYLEAETSQKNETADGKTALDTPDAATILNAAFAAEAGDQHEAIELASDAYAWFDVQAITPAKLKEFEAVKEDVKKDYIEAETRKKVAELAQGLVGRLNKGEDIAKVATDAGGTVDTKDTLRRDMVPPDLTQQAMRQAFALPKGQAGSAETSDGATRVVFRVDEITPAGAMSESEEKEITSAVAQELRSDLIGTYIEALKSKLGTYVNEKQLKRITGAEVAE